MTDPLHTYRLDQVHFKLREPHDFSWLQGMGTVFAVFDQQDSGNISFGVEKQGQRLFVKAAGLRTQAYEGETMDAVTRLRHAIPVYEELRHPGLIKLVDHFPVGTSSYAAVFDWFEGECLHPHWSFPPPAKYDDPRSPFYRFKKLPVARRIEALERILQFHQHVEDKGYVAIDFYDGSILYNFSTHETMICDIDLYAGKPFYNTMGRLWGSSRFMSPEEYELGPVIDSRTNVYNMGAMAFGLLGGERDRSIEKWEAGAELYDVALHAVQSDRAGRYATIAEFYDAWKAQR
ncbi:serine/threonine protein kinase [Paenibacillus sp. 1P07SE]|uniref:serine/threonine protein kinase n=1 Tax=Paenibacillus sp. 1P07SE TaxID=3132209 RepID=UPI0039A48FFD